MRGKALKITAVLALWAFFCMNTLGCSRPEKYTRTGFLMDTKVDVALYGVDKRQAAFIADKIFAEMQRLEAIFSRHVTDSDISRVNKAAGKAPVKVNPETILVVSRALEIAALSDGAFDPTVGPLLELWGWGTENLRVPSPEEIEKLLPLVDFKEVVIDEKNATIFLPRPGMKLDLGAIAKGFIVDRGQAVAAQFSVQASFINAGGDISIAGSKPSGEKWRIAIQAPRDPQKWAAVIEIDEGSVATSGDYQRFFEEEGKVFHHILDPQERASGGGCLQCNRCCRRRTFLRCPRYSSFCFGQGKRYEVAGKVERCRGSYY